MFRYMLGGGDIVGTVDDVYALNKAIKHKLLLTEETHALCMWAELV